MGEQSSTNLLLDHVPKVEQSPSRSTVKALAEEELLHCQNKDVKVEVASFIGEETRIPVPAAPHDANQMKEVVSPAKPSKVVEDECLLEKAVKTSFKRKRPRSKREAIIVKKFAEGLVGAKIKVLWPKDKMFYAGVVDSFNSETKKHKIIYADGYMEWENLEKEMWKLIEDDRIKDGVVSPEKPSNAVKDDSLLEKAIKKSFKRKRTYPTEKPINVKKFGEDLVGAKIKVLWPMDKRFYVGVVYSFDSTTRKHEIIYADGELERLDLEEETWDLIEDKDSTKDGASSISPMASDYYSVFFQELASFEATLHQASITSEFIGMAASLDQQQLEILNKFYNLLEIPVYNLSTSQLAELTEVIKQLESFAHLVLSLEQRARLNIYLGELTASFEGMKIVQARILSAQSSIERVSDTKAKLKENRKACESIHAALGKAMEKEEDLRKQFNAAREEREGLQQQLMKKTQETKKLMTTIAGCPSEVNKTQKCLRFYQAQMAHHVRRWEEFKTLFQDNPRN